MANSPHNDNLPAPQASSVPAPSSAPPSPAATPAAAVSAGVVLSPAYGAYLQTLPATRELRDDERLMVDIREGIHPTAAASLERPSGRSLYEVLGLVSAVLFFMVLIMLAFPWRHFIKTAPKNDALSMRSPLLVDKPPRAVQSALDEIDSLRRSGRLHGARDKCAEYLDALPNQQSEHLLWLPVWQHRLELLYVLRAQDELKRQCSRLRVLVPDAVEALYYPARLDVEAVPRLSNYRQHDQDYYRKLLDFQLKKCEGAEAALTARPATPPVLDALAAFRLLLADIHRRQWWVSNFSWSDEHLEESFTALRSLPEETRQSLRLRLSLLRDCRARWRRWWQRRPSTRIIDGQPMTEMNLEQEIAMTESLLLKPGKN